MLDPTCKICGERHRLGPCGGAQVMTKPARTIQKTPEIRHVLPVTSAAADEPKKRFDRTAYQRELMRKRRAAAKANPT